MLIFSTARQNDLIFIIGPSQWLWVWIVKFILSCLAWMMLSMGILQFIPKKLDILALHLSMIFKILLWTQSAIVWLMTNSVIKIQNATRMIKQSRNGCVFKFQLKKRNEFSNYKQPTSRSIILKSNIHFLASTSYFG